MFKKIILASALAGLVACSYNGDSRDGNRALRQKDNEQREIQESEFNSISGLYTGKLIIGAAQQDVKLRLFTLEQKLDQPGPDGSDRFRKVLRGNYKPTHPVGQAYNFYAGYTPETGALVLTNAGLTTADGKSIPLGVDDIHTINAIVSGDFIKGEVKSPSGPMGRIELTRSANENQTPGNNEGRQNYDDLKREYQRVAGVYQGENMKGDKVVLTLNLEVVDGIDAPSLIGRMNRSDDNALKSSELSLTVSYDAQTPPTRIKMIGKPQKYPNSDYTATYLATYENETISGSWQSNKRGFEGEFILKKVK